MVHCLWFRGRIREFRDWDEFKLMCRQPVGDYRQPRQLVRLLAALQLLQNQSRSTKSTLVRLPASFSPARTQD